MILSVFESESDQKYENKYDISDIRPYPIRFHPYSRVKSQLREISQLRPGGPLQKSRHNRRRDAINAIPFPFGSQGTAASSVSSSAMASAGGAGADHSPPPRSLVFAFYLTGHGFGHATRAIEVSHSLFRR